MRVDNDVIGICATNTFYAFNEDTKETIIVDPSGEYPKILNSLSKRGLTPVGILLTHGHFDHILAVDELRERFQIPVYAGIHEREVLQNPTLNLSDSFTNQPITLEADHYLEDGSEITLAGYQIQGIEVPGHTIGGMCYYFKEESILFSGDTLFCESVGRSDFPGGDGRALYLGIKNRLLVLPDDTRVFPGHMDDTTIGYEKIHNPFCR